MGLKKSQSKSNINKNRANSQPNRGFNKAEPLNKRVSSLRGSQPRSTTMKMSSSSKNFPHTLGVPRAQRTEPQAINAIKRAKGTEVISNSKAVKPTPQDAREFKKVLIHEVNELKQRMKEHFRHISNLSPDKVSSKHSRSASRSRSRSRKSRSPIQPQKAMIPAKRGQVSFLNLTTFRCGTTSRFQRAQFYQLAFQSLLRSSSKDMTTRRLLSTGLTNRVQLTTVCQCLTMISETMHR